MTNPIEKTSLVKKDLVTERPILVLDQLDKPISAQVATLNKRLTSAVHAFGMAGLEVGKVLQEGQTLLQPLGLFGPWVNSHPGFSVTTAYRLIAIYKASERLAQPILDLAIATGMSIVGTARKPYGRYTDAVNQVGPPPPKPSKEDAGLWLQRVSHTYNQIRRAARSAQPALEECVKTAVETVSRIGNKLPSPEERGVYLHSIIEECSAALGLKPSEVLKKKVVSVKTSQKTALVA